MSDLLTQLTQLVQNNSSNVEQVAKQALQSHAVTDVQVNSDTVTVTCGPFTGYHGLRDEQSGGVTPTTVGSYVHDPTGVEFEAECPDVDTLQRTVRRCTVGEGKKEAARYAHRTSRM